jgi:hypothetical protein
MEDGDGGWIEEERLKSPGEEQMGFDLLVMYI